MSADEHEQKLEPEYKEQNDSTTLFGKFKRHAIFDEGKNYRYVLETIWDDRLPVLCSLFCNPSRAGAFQEDNTDKAFRKRARALGYGGACMLNAFAFISPTPKALHMFKGDVVGRNNDWHILQCLVRHGNVLCGWGPNAELRNRDTRLYQLLKEAQAAREKVGGKMEIYCLKMTKGGHPQHPLYISDTAPLMPFTVIRAGG